MPPEPPTALLAAYTASFPDSPPEALTTGPGGSVWIAARRATEPLINLVTPDLGGHVIFKLSQPGASPHRLDLLGMPLPPWALYVGAVGWAWGQRGHAVPGLDAVLLAAGGMPEGYVWESGLAAAAAWQDLGGWPTPDGGLLGLLLHLGGYFHPER